MVLGDIEHEDAGTVDVTHDNAQAKPGREDHQDHQVQVCQVSTVSRHPDAEVPPRRVLIGVEEYLQIQRVLMAHLAHQQELGIDTSQEWYMADKEDEFDTVEQMQELLRLVETVLWRTI